MDEIWAELSAAMRSLRRNAGVSLRTAEALSGIRRGTLSQAENAKARPSRRAVEYYDTAFGGDGLLVSMWAEARVAGGPGTSAGSRAIADDDRLAVTASVLPFGHLASPGERLIAGWTLRNAGTVAWRGRRLRRVGPPVAPRLVGSEASVAVPDCEAGDDVRVTAVLTLPAQAGTVAAYWQLDAAGGDAVVGSTDAVCVVISIR